TERNILQSPFTDESHVIFYHSPPHTHAPPPLRAPPLRPSQFRPPAPHSSAPAPPSQHTSLKKELAELKLLVKQKEKELKAAKKEEKKKMKVGFKERKKVVKASKDCQSSESSSSSESSEASMRRLRKTNPMQYAKLKDEHGLGQKVTSDELLDEHEKEVSGKVMLKGRLESVKSPVASCTCPLRADQSPNRIEVCLGGKCKKAGSDLLLQELRSHVTNGCNVEAVPCKCMGTMLNGHKHEGLQGGSMAVPQQHSHVGVDDAKFILASHFGFAPSPSARPSLPVASGTGASITASVNIL
ncbi:hypothetical protein KP509_24G051600, partial [Ceratopteris richardii]